MLNSHLSRSHLRQMLKSDPWDRVSALLQDRYRQMSRVCLGSEVGPDLLRAQGECRLLALLLDREGILEAVEAFESVDG